MSNAQGILIGFGLPLLMTLALVPRAIRYVRQIINSPHMSQGMKAGVLVMLAMPLPLIAFIWIQALVLLPQMLRMM